MFRLLLILGLFIMNLSVTKAQDKKIFVWGGDINLKFTRYIVDLTGKEHPRLCYLPTASGDNPDNIRFWGSICNALKIDTLVMNVWVSASPDNQSFEDILLHSDAIVVGGGNTLNMIGIWKAQGIDKILKKALDKGIILSGGSAGSICWFEKGISDSRPTNISAVEGLGLLPYSNCPHYSQKERRDLFHKLINNKEIHPGYAFDEKAGILFVNGKAKEFVTQNDKHHVYYVFLKGKQLEIKDLEAKKVISKHAIPEGEYQTTKVEKKLSEITLEGKSTPLSAYVMIVKEISKGKESFLNSSVNKIFIYKNKIAGVVNDKYLDSMGVYGLWYFYNHNGVWENAGEDIGGETVLESEITFREKAKVILSKRMTQ